MGRGAHQEPAFDEPGIGLHRWTLLLGEVGLAVSIHFDKDVGTSVMDEGGFAASSFYNEDVGTPLLECGSVTSLSTTVAAPEDAASNPRRQVGEGTAARIFRPAAKQVLCPAVPLVVRQGGEGVEEDCKIRDVATHPHQQGRRWRSGFNSCFGELRRPPASLLSLSLCAQH
nr:unnamed protein product [Digitaria exilis]